MGHLEIYASIVEQTKVSICEVRKRRTCLCCPWDADDRQKNILFLKKVPDDECSRFVMLFEGVDKRHCEITFRDNMFGMTCFVSGCVCVSYVIKGKSVPLFYIPSGSSLRCLRWIGRSSREKHRMDRFHAHLLSTPLL